MVAKRKGLGKGLDALLMNEVNNVTTPVINPTELPVVDCFPGVYQPRKEMDTDAIKTLAASIKAQGVLQPIIVRADEKTGKYEIIAGERRWRATKLAGLKNIPVIIKDYTHQQSLEVGLVENIQRRDLNAIEKAKALSQLVKKFNLTQQEVAEKLGWPRPTVANYLRLTGLNEKVQSYLIEGKLDMGHARALLSLDENEQWHAADTIVDKHFNVRQTEDYVRRLQIKETVIKKTSTASINPYQEKLAEKLKLKIKLTPMASGKGKIVIYYKNEDEIDELINKIQA